MAYWLRARQALNKHMKDRPQTLHMTCFGCPTGLPRNRTGPITARPCFQRNRSRENSPPITTNAGTYAMLPYRPRCLRKKDFAPGDWTSCGRHLANPIVPKRLQSHPRPFNCVDVELLAKEPAEPNQVRARPYGNEDVRTVASRIPQLKLAHPCVSRSCRIIAWSGEQTLENNAAMTKIMPTHHQLHMRSAATSRHKRATLLQWRCIKAMPWLN